ncbi:MAG: ornithine cyclodeaminase family protein [Deltaproteobacteria bacterium]|nr:ornithine cyclodeaminase family protein [Deltaproteobacteria bacterium]
MLFLSESDVKKALTMDDVIESVEGAYRDYSKKLVDVPSRITLHVRDENNDAIFLTANYHSMPFYGIKQASSFPSNVRKGKETVLADIHLYSADTGEALAVVSATYLTALKTGAASAIATKFLAKEEACILAIIGTGAQARTQLDGIQRVRRLKEVRLFDLDLEKAEKFQRYIEEIKNRDYNTIITNSANECIESADIVTTVTTSSRPVFDGKYLGDGIHINAVGSFTPNMQEIDSDTVMKAKKIVTDIQKESWAVAGDLLVPLKEGKITQEKMYAELGDIVAGKIPGREDEKEVTIYESVGFAALDIAVAITAYRKSLTAGIGSIVEQ